MIDFVTIAKSTNIFKIFKIRVFPDFWKNRIPDPDFFGLKPSRDQDGANKKKFSQIGRAVLEEIGRKHTNKHANIVLLYKREELMVMAHGRFNKFP